MAAIKRRKKRLPFFFSEERTKPLLDEANAIVRTLGKGVSTTRRRIATGCDDGKPMRNAGQ